MNGGETAKKLYPQSKVSRRVRWVADIATLTRWAGKKHTVVKERGVLDL